MVATRDWHPPDHASFQEQGGPWPPHCVQGSHGAELHPSLDRDKIDAVVDAGYRPELEGYSGFEETDLAERAARATTWTRSRWSGSPPTTASATRPSTHCARASGSRSTGGGIRGIDVKEGDSERALDELRAAGADGQRDRRASSTSMFHWYRLVGGASEGARALERDGVVARRGAGGTRARRGERRALPERGRPRGRLRRARRRLRRDRREVDGLGPAGRRRGRRAARGPRSRARRSADGDGADLGSAWSARRPMRCRTGPPTATLAEVGQLNDRAYTSAPTRSRARCRRCRTTRPHIYVARDEDEPVGCLLDDATTTGNSEVADGRGGARGARARHLRKPARATPSPTPPSAAARPPR